MLWRILRFSSFFAEVVSRLAAGVVRRKLIRSSGLPAALGSVPNPNAPRR
jgi:hypothetical protein